jgi:hypothetical protein
MNKLLMSLMLRAANNDPMLARIAPFSPRRKIHNTYELGVVSALELECAETYGFEDPENFDFVELRPARR